MLIKKTIALLRALQSRLLSKRIRHQARASTVVTGVDIPVSDPERRSAFTPSSKYADYVASVAYSDRRYPDTRYLSRS